MAFIRLSIIRKTARNTAARERNQKNGASVMLHIWIGAFCSITAMYLT